MTFHTAIVLLANGILASKARGAPLDPGERCLLDKKVHCVRFEAATTMCSVARNYRRTFGDFRLSAVSATHCLLSATLVLMQVASTENESSCGRAAAANVDRCLQSLKELSVSWKMADKTYRNLAMLKAQRIGPKAHAGGVLLLTQSQASTLHTDTLSDPATSRLTHSTSSRLANPILFDNTYTDRSNASDTFDFAAQLADIDF